MDRRPARAAGPPLRRPSVRAPGDALELACRHFAQLYLEVEAGRRPRSQLRGLMTWALYVQLSDVWIRGGAPGRVLRVHGQLVAPGRYEAVVIVRRSQRTGALAIRLRRIDAGWRVENALRPEDGPLPPPAIPLPHSEPDAFEIASGSPSSGGLSDDKAGGTADRAGLYG